MKFYSVTSFLVFFRCFVWCEQEEKPRRRWCNRELPVVGGKFFSRPPYWELPDPNCPTTIFDHKKTIDCMKGRTLYTMGNSIGRQAAFGMVDMLGGGMVKREDQRDECPKHETTWGDSCHHEFAGVKIKYLFIQFMDGFDYTNRRGAPFIKHRVKLPNGKSEWVIGKHPTKTVISPSKCVISLHL